jgi:hypothetical protein
VILVWTLLVGVASYRVFRLIAEDSIMEPVRLRLPDWDWFGEWLYCPWCLGSWIAFGVTWITDATIGLQAPVLVALAAAVVVGWLGEHL